MKILAIILLVLVNELSGIVIGMELWEKFKDKEKQNDERRSKRKDILSMARFS